MIFAAHPVAGLKDRVRDDEIKSNLRTRKLETATWKLEITERLKSLAPLDLCDQLSGLFTQTKTSTKSSTTSPLEITAEARRYTIYSGLMLASHPLAGGPGTVDSCAVQCDNLSDCGGFEFTGDYCYFSSTDGSHFERADEHSFYSVSLID